MVERHLLEGDLRAFVPCQQLVPHNDVFERARVGIFFEIREDDGLLERRYLLLQPRDDIYPVIVFAAVAVAVDRDEDLRLYLFETVHDAAGAEVGGAARPDRAYGGTG